MRLRRVSENLDWPWGSSLLTYYLSTRGDLTVITEKEALIRVKKGRKVYATWHGQWRTDLFVMDVSAS